MNRPAFRLSRRGVLGGAALAVPVLAACSAPGESQSTAPGPSAAPQTIRFANWQADYKPFQDQIFPSFSEKTRVTVDYELHPSGGPWAEKMTALFVSGDPPDVAHSNSHTDTRFYDGGDIMDLGPVVAREKLNLDRDYVLMGTERWCG